MRNLYVEFNDNKILYMDDNDNSGFDPDDFKNITQRLKINQPSITDFESYSRLLVKTNKNNLYWIKYIKKEVCHQKN